ncbi:MAG TPA: CoA ester lyase [Candidatus Acidoferrales bacterium]|nr:CoA ester lyase [Candidatus Acidoferrales bacterium]
MRPRRSCLAVPGSQPRFLEGAARSAADEVFFDLEDSVAPAAKEKARGLVAEALRRHSYEGKVRVVRVNACDTRWCYEDVVAVVEGAGDRLDCVMLPKVEGVEHVHFLDQLLGQLERKLGLERRLGLELQIESARGLEKIGEIAAASPRTETLIFGPGDFAASMRMPGLTIGALVPDYPGDFWHYFMARILVAARAHGLQAIDGPYVQIHDREGLRTFAQRAARLGYDGKWALHPAQVEVLNQVFAPDQRELDRAAAILEAYRRATDVDQRGAVMLGDEMIDEASRKLAEATVERGQAYGMEAKPWTPPG